MKRWFDYLRNSFLATEVYDHYKVSKEMQIACDKVWQFCCDNELLKNKVEVSHYGDIDSLVEEYMDVYPKIFTNEFISEEELTEWLKDKEYKALLDVNMHTIDGSSIPEEILQELYNAFIKQEDVEEGSLSFRMHVHYPGDLYHLHYDSPKTLDSHSIDTEYRALVCLTDRAPGQFLQMGNDQVSWKKYDIIKWGKPYTMHGGANVGYEPRVVLRISWNTNRK